MKIRKDLMVILHCAIGALFIYTACSSDRAHPPFAPENPSEPTIVGLELLRNGRPIAIVDKGIVNGTVAISMTQNSDVYEAEFFDENGELVNKDPHLLKLAYTIEDSELATIEQPDDLGDWEFHMNGKKAGDTALQLSLENGTSVSYTSPAIPLTVTQ